MGELKTKDELVHLLRSGLIDEFNDSRPFDNDNKLDLTEIDLGNARITGANLSRVDLSGSDFCKAELENIDFKESDLSSANFSHSTMTEVNFAEAVLEGSLFNHAAIEKSDFTACDMNGVNICGTDLTGTDLSLCKNLMQSVYDGETVWPDDDQLPEDFDPMYEMSFAEMEETEGFSEDQYSY